MSYVHVTRMANVLVAAILARHDDDGGDPAGPCSDMTGIADCERCNWSLEHHYEADRIRAAVAYVLGDGGPA